MENPVVFFAAKDKPVLLTAYAFADVLLTMDRGDFGAVIGGWFYSLYVDLLGDFLKKERAKGLPLV